MTRYSPSAIRTFEFCQKKYYFQWLNQKKQGWRKPIDHPWHKVYALKRVKSHSAWAGDVYHSVLADTLRQVTEKRRLNYNDIKQLALDVVALQFEFSQRAAYVGLPESKAPKHQGISLFLALFDHVYDLPVEGLLDRTQQKLSNWLDTTFQWVGWVELLDEIDAARYVHIEPNNCWYEIGGTKVSARMDVGIERRDKTFVIYDWKCYSDVIDFAEHNEQVFRRQLLAYALWPVLRTNYPLPVESITGRVFYPTNGSALEFGFLEEDLWDFEIEMDNWTHFHNDVFDTITDIDFNDLPGPFDPQRSCPWCSFKSICGESILWHKLR